MLVRNTISTYPQSYPQPVDNFYPHGWKNLSHPPYTGQDKLRQIYDKYATFN